MSVNPTSKAMLLMAAGIAAATSPIRKALSNPFGEYTPFRHSRGRNTTQRSQSGDKLARKALEGRVGLATLR